MQCILTIAATQYITIKNGCRLKQLLCPSVLNAHFNAVFLSFRSLLLLIITAETTTTKWNKSRTKGIAPISTREWSGCTCREMQLHLCVFVWVYICWKSLTQISFVHLYSHLYGIWPINMIAVRMRQTVSFASRWTFNQCVRRTCVLCMHALNISVQYANQPGGVSVNQQTHNAHIGFQVCRCRFIDTIMCKIFSHRVNVMTWFSRNKKKINTRTEFHDQIINESAKWQRQTDKQTNRETKETIEWNEKHDNDNGRKKNWEKTFVDCQFWPTKQLFYEYIYVAHNTMMSIG